MARRITCDCASLWEDLKVSYNVKKSHVGSFENHPQNVPLPTQKCSMSPYGDWFSPNSEDDFSVLLITFVVGISVMSGFRPCTRERRVGVFVALVNVVTAAAAATATRALNSNIVVRTETDYAKARRSDGDRDGDGGGGGRRRATVVGQVISDKTVFLRCCFTLHHRQHRRRQHPCRSTSS